VRFDPCAHLVVRRQPGQPASQARLTTAKILFNLLSNAVKFTPEGGSVRLTARGVHSSQFPVDGPDKADRELSTVNREQRGEFIEIAVADTGIGIKAEDLLRHFQEFVQLEAMVTQRAEGTGLGLALTRRLVELHGAGSGPSRLARAAGSTFTIWLPLEPALTARGDGT
jgi:signal transduction histidine kinase